MQGFPNFLPSTNKMTGFDKLFVVNDKENEDGQLTVNDISIWRTTPPQTEPVYANTIYDMKQK